MKKLLIPIFLFLSFQYLFAQKHLELVHQGYSLAEIEKIMTDYLLTADSNYREHKSYKKWYNDARSMVDERGEWNSKNAYRYYLSSNNLTPNTPGQIISNASQSNAVDAISNYPCNFEFIGPSNVPTLYTMKVGIGRINCIAFHPTIENTFYVGAATGGVWRTDDGGYNWTNTSEFLTNLGVSDLKIDPNNPENIYWVTGDYDGASTFYTTIFKSTDGGNSWQEIGFNNTLGDGRLFSTILINPDNSNIVLIAGSQGVYRSTNGGQTFTQTLSGQSVCDMEFHPTNPNIIYAFDAPLNRFSRSTDGGQSWSTVNSGLPNTTLGRGEIAVAPSNPNRVYIILTKPNGDFGLYGIYKSDNSGQSFSAQHVCIEPSALTPNILGWSLDGSDSRGQGWYDLAFVVDPENADRVLSGGINIWESNNAGQNWSFIQSDYHVDIHALAFNPLNGKLYTATDGGITSISENYNAENLSDGLEITQYYSIDVDQNNGEKVIGGAQDNAVHLLTNNEWFVATNGDGLDAMIDYSNSDVMYGNSQNGDFLFRTLDGNVVFNSNFAPIGGGSWKTPLAMDLNNPNTIYAGYDRLYKSTNRGDDWTAISETTTTNRNLDCIATTKNSNIIYTSSGDVLYKTINGGNTWIEITGDWSGRFISSIAANTANPNHLWISRSTSGVNKVVHSTNGGNTWIDQSNGLPALRSNFIAIDESTNNMFLGTESGIFHSKKDDVDWSNLGVNLGFPNVSVKELVVQDNNRELYIATYGRGIWKVCIDDGKPEAIFSSDLNITCINTNISFIDESNGNPSSWSWNFGDGTTSTLQNPIHSYSSPGVYTVTLTITNENGDTDATQIVDYITVLHNENMNIIASDCESYEYNGVSYNTTGNHIQDLGCAQINIDLTIYQPDFSQINQEDCESYTWHDNTYTESGIYEYETTDEGGCVDREELVLDIIGTNDTTYFQDACVTNVYIGGVLTQTGGYTWYDSTYFSAGIYFHESVDENGCSYTERLVLAITHTHNTDQNVSACESFIWEKSGQTYTESGTYTFTEIDENGCSLVHILTLTIQNDMSTTLNITADGSYEWNGTTYYCSGTYIDSGFYGCDYTHTLNLTINNSTLSVTNANSCNFYIWGANGVTYSESGVYTISVPYEQMCWSQHILNLNITNESSSITNINTDNDFYVWNGQTYYCSGTYSVPFISSQGCDSIAHLNLTLNNGW